MDKMLNEHLETGVKVKTLEEFPFLSYVSVSKNLNIFNNQNT